MGKSGNKVKRRDCARLCPTIEKQFGKKSGLYLVNWRNIISGVCLLLLFKFEHSLFKKKKSTKKRQRHYDRSFQTCKSVRREVTVKRQITRSRPPIEPAHRRNDSPRFLDNLEDRCFVARK
jgi:hypothetical protein